MPENQSAEHERAGQIVSQLAARSTEQLEQELAELMLADSDSDEALDRIDAYLAELEKRDPGKAGISAEASLQDFHEKYDFLFPEPSGAQQPGHVVPVSAEAFWSRQWLWSWSAFFLCRYSEPMCFR
jgi:hypothetical protein